MYKKETIKKLVEIYEEAIKTGEKGLKAGVNYDFNLGILDFKSDGKDYKVSKYDLSDKPDGVGDEMANKIITWSQQKFG
jgi:hypothetical protein